MPASRMHQQQMHKPLWHFFSSQPDYRHPICTQRHWKKISHEEQQCYIIPKQLQKVNTSFQTLLFLEDFVAVDVLTGQLLYTTLSLLQYERPTEMNRYERWKTEAALVAQHLSTLSAFGCQRSQLHAPFSQLILNSCEMLYHEVTRP